MRVVNQSIIHNDVKEFPWRRNWKYSIIHNDVKEFPWCRIWKYYRKRKLVPIKDCVLFSFTCNLEHWCALSNFCVYSPKTAPLRTIKAEEQKKKNKKNKNKNRIRKRTQKTWKLTNLGALPKYESSYISGSSATSLLSRYICWNQRHEISSNCSFSA